MIQAVEDKIIVEELRRTKTKGGIVIPITAVEPQAYGKVLSVGPGVPHWEDESVSIKEGDVLVYHKMGGQAMSFNNKIYCCVPYAEVFGILTDQDILDELDEFELKPEVDSAKSQPSQLIQRV